MASQSVVHVPNGRAHREKAARMRKLSWTVCDDRTIKILMSYAAELEETASNIDVQAGRTAQLSNDTASETLNEATGAIGKARSVAARVAPRSPFISPAAGPNGKGAAGPFDLVEMLRDRAVDRHHRDRRSLPPAP
jgi:hypothetical protein